MNVSPDGEIDPASGAEISNAGGGTLTVTITNQNGDSETIQVPAGEVVTWHPPEGWTSATFRAPGHGEEFRTIGTAAEAAG